MFTGWVVEMVDKLYLNNEVSEIVGLTQRQILSWTERGIVEPEKPAKKAGHRRGYNYINLLEFGLAKYLLDYIGLQFFTAKQILTELRKDGEFAVWASDYSNYQISFALKIMDSKKEIIAESFLRLREKDPDGLGGISEIDADIKRVAEKNMKSNDFCGTLYYIFFRRGGKKSYIETTRVISPWDINRSQDVFNYFGYNIEFLKSKGMIVANLGEIKKEINERLNT